MNQVRFIASIRRVTGRAQFIFGSPIAEEGTMRAIVTAALAAATIGLFAISLSAAPVGAAAKQNSTPLIRLAQYDEHHGDEHQGDDHHGRCHRHRVCDDHHRHCHWVCD
jgi:hypothetical protein